MKSNYLYILIIILLIMPFVSAINERYPVNQEVELKFTCTLNGAIPTASATYNFTISYPNGTTYLNNKQATSQGQGSFNYSTNFPELGTYKIQSFCYDGSLSYSNTEYLDITPNGENFGEDSTLIIIGQLGMIALFLTMAFAFSKEKWKIRMFFFMSAILMGILTLNSIRIISGLSNSLNSMGNIGLLLGIVILSVMFIYILIYYTIELFNYFKKRNRQKWEINSNPS